MPDDKKECPLSNEGAEGLMEEQKARWRIKGPDGGDESPQEEIKV